MTEGWHKIQRKAYFILKNINITKLNVRETCTHALPFTHFIQIEEKMLKWRLEGPTYPIFPLQEITLSAQRTEKHS